ncbi:hypothetical protein CRM22_011087 [Opisthorchis felineus]|uniref:PUA domain-containing protein n=1 Tax=Opisthorchis felineus TaxID=147828 RepID=A0A4V3S9V4_OPIFE|nr:hypothetical protein CRM22_011087 [Opisthorchis felineus]
MFKKFDEKEDVSSVTNAKNSRAKAIRKRVCEDYDVSSGVLEQILPKKDALKVVKCHEHIELFADLQGDVLFFCQRDGPFIPSLKLLHKYPFLLPHLQVDRGAIKHVLNGSNIMCPGLTSAGARMTQVPQDSIVAIMAEGKEHALAIGSTVMSTDEILAMNKGIGVENLHYLLDGLWRLKPLR